jgi:8-oxo-dGTP pyrophosphatase MutT (NUDIX family)
MHYTKIVTSFIKNDNNILILKRSNKVKSMKGLWAGVSGIIESDEEPLVRAKIEIFEEVGIEEEHLKLLKSPEQIRVESPQYRNHKWEIFPFLFETKNTEIKLNWENSEFKWVEVNQLKEFETVPNLEEILFSLL